MIKKAFKSLILPFLVITFAGCASYSVTEQDMTKYLDDNVSFEQSVGVENVMHAFVSIHDMDVSIGRVDADRVSVLANTIAKIQIWNQPEKKLELDLEFSAVPQYDKETGEIFLKSLRLDRFDEESQLLTPEIKQLLKPAVSMIGTALSQYPVYKLDSSKVEQALLKSVEPNLVIKDNKLVIELFD
ncbi:DUF1439 domain-containing protein [Vibrio ziniensis]|uniref:DUF1439 domain-containing protein n=1 Tax=Vibrio ziniensis TaxID=2711221 RepID=A0A6G7CQV7_9VIBR|nr:DUF1439 domain-containing protein [Vibrio ziniensis]QIH44426.1 DUF1439 domain-containing protein [Vibrio ziniensis]